MKDPFPIGMTLNERAYVLTRELVTEHLMAIDVRNSKCYSGEDAICPPGMLCIEPVRFPDWPGYGTRTVLNSRCEWDLYRPTFPGQRLTLKCRVSDRWLKRGKEYITFEMPVLGEGGELVSLCRFSEALLQPPQYSPPLQNRDHERSARYPEPAGPELGSLARAFTLEMSKAIAGTVNDWHTNREKAQERGLKDVLLTGPHFIAQMMELMTQIFGRGFVEGGRFGVNALRPVLVGQQITARAFEHHRLTDSDGVQRVEVLIWCEDENEVKTFAGTASARLTNGEPLRVMDPAPVR